MGKEVIMPKAAVSYCPFKFIPKTLSEDGVVKKFTCECEESLCAWWNSANSCCVILTIGAGVEISTKVHELEKVKLQLLLANEEEKKSLAGYIKAQPFVRLAHDTTEAIK